MDGSDALAPNRLPRITGDVPPLSGVRVLDMTRFVAGPYCTMLLSDAGADVIKVEPLEGEETRTLDPLLAEGAGVTHSGYFLRFNRGKRSVALDLRTDDGREVLARLIAGSDVLVENYRPGVLARLGFDDDRIRSLNPALVYCSISGFGHSGGPYGAHPAFAILAEVMAGVLVHNPREGEPPIWTGLGVGDLFPAALSVSGIAMALLRRERTGLGARVDMAMYDAMASLNERAISFGGLLGREVRIGQQEMIAPFGLFKARDGYLCIAVIGERVWRAFCEAIGQPELLDDPRLSSGRARADHLRDVLLPVIEGWLAMRDRTQAVEELLAGGVPAGPVRFASEVLDCPQAKHRHMVTEVGYRNSPVHRVIGNPIKIGPDPEPAARVVPDVGQHTVEILREVGGYDSAAVDDMVRRGVVRGG